MRVDQYGFWVVRLYSAINCEGRLSTDWQFSSHQLQVIDLTPEEELKLQAEEQERQRQIEDQERRKQHADKYL